MFSWARGAGKPTKKDLDSIRPLLFEGDGTLKTLAVNEIKDLGDIAPAYVKLKSAEVKERKVSETTTKGKALDHSTQEFLDYQAVYVTDKIKERFNKFAKDGLPTENDLSEGQLEWLNRALDATRSGSEVLTVSDLTDPSASDPAATTTAPATPSSPRPESVLSGTATPSTTTNPPQTEKPLSDWILELANGLMYDRFDSKKVRMAFFSKDKVPSVHEFVTIATAYLYVGNNPSKLTTSVTDKTIGQTAMGVLNTYGIKNMKPTDKTTMTLARFGISMAPAIWTLRNMLKAKEKLQTSGINSSTPSELQDVALSGCSQFIKDGDNIKDFLIKFNRVLTNAREVKDKKSKSSDDDRDNEADKYFQLARSGAKDDKLIREWDYDSAKAKTIDSIEEFYKKCLEEAQETIL